MIAAATFLALALLPQRARAEVRCDYGQRIECTSTGCRLVAATGGFLKLAPASMLVAATTAAKDAASLPTIQVCDATTCTPIPVRAALGGAFVNIAQDGGAHFVKVAMRDVPPGIRTGDFIEVAAQFLSTVTHVGACPAAAR